ncbi:hypothetical protein VFPBJ_00810 [Purpureocillium lilacinum]|uniref:Uncharacterized protein n=1 Tax=Purpureocillium lilacinum TaxID=33203 RepID=A0A179HAZ6_PURLI|nr:hypothetical protein VFPBJ_00810 [Purpureocillium lilacinum]
MGSSVPRGQWAFAESSCSCSAHQIACRRLFSRPGSSIIAQLSRTTTASPAPGAAIIAGAGTCLQHYVSANPLDPLCRISRATRDHAATPPPQVANDLLPLRNDRRRQLLRRRAPAYPALPRAPDQVRRWGGHSGREREEEEVEEEGSRGKQGRNCTVQSDGRRRHIYQRGADDERVPRAEAGRHAGRMARLSQERRRDGKAMTTTGGKKNIRSTTNV